jgi:filamentous hemagglutinin
MKKGLLTVLLASLVLVGCQNYDDQFDDLNAQISALKSQVDGLSSLSGQVSSLSGSISGLSAGVAAAQAAASAAGVSADAATAAANGIDLSGLSASLATLQAEVDAVQASLATTSTAAAVATLQAEIDAIEADVDELLATSNVYNQSLTISSASSLDAAVALGSNINIVNGTVTITQSSTMDATKLQSVINKIFTVTNSYSYTAANTNVTAMTFDNLASAGDVTLKVNGPISAKALVTAGTITLDDSYISKVTSINLDALTTVTEIQTDSGGTDNIVFTSATDVQLGALTSYPGAGSDYGLTITTKADATLDIGSLDDVKTDGTAAPVALTLNGPKDVTISNMTAYAGSLSLTNVENATVTGFKGAITVNGGVENITMTDVEDFAFSSATGLKTVTLDVDKASDPALTATAKAPAAYAGAVTGYTGPTPDLSFASMSSLTSVTLTGFYDSLDFDGLANLATIDLDVTTGDLTINNNDNLTSLDVTGSEIGNVTVTNNDGISTVDLDHTTDLNFNGATADRTSVSLTVTGNSEMTTLHNSGDKVLTMNVTSNAKLATVDFTGMATQGTGTATIDVYSNALVASQASDTDDGLTQYDVDGTNDATDLGSYTTTSGIGTLKTYLTAANTASNDIAVHFDTVQLHNIAADANTSSETAGDQNSGNALTYATDGGEKTAWIGAILMNTKSTLSTTNPTSYSAVKAKSGWLVDNSVATSLSIAVDGDIITHDTDGFSAVALSGVNAADVTALMNSTATARATDLGVTLNVEAQGSSTLPNITFLGSITPTTGNNGENYTNTTASTLSKLLGDSGGVASVLTSYDQVTMGIGDTSVTATITGGTTLTGDNAMTNLAAQLVSLWNTKYSTGGVSEVFSFWSTMSASAGVITAPTLTSSLSGSRAFDDTVTISFSPASSTRVSMESSGTHTTSRLAWKIGSSDATTDNVATGVTLIVTLEEAVAGNNKLALASLTTNVDVLTLTSAIGGTAGTDPAQTGFLLATNKIGFGSSSANSIEGGVTDGIFPTDARGDVVTGQTAEGGLDVTTGTAQFNRTRLHWLG